MAPLRGLLSLIILLGGFAGTLFYQEDQKQKLFDVLPGSRTWYFPYLYLYPAVWNSAIAVLIACYVSGIWTKIWNELLLMTLYGIMCIGFCNLVRCLCKTQQVLAAAIPILLCAMLVVCPVFVSIPHIQLLGRLFPPYYYLRALYRPECMKEMLLYVGAVYGVYSCGLKKRFL